MRIHVWNVACDISKAHDGCSEQPRDSETKPSVNTFQNLQPFPESQRAILYSFITVSPVRGCPSGLAQSISLPFETDRLVFHVSCSACNCSWYFRIIMCYNRMLHCIGTDRIFLPYGYRPTRSRLAEYLEEK